MAMRSSDQFMTKYYSAIRTACKVPFLSVIRGGWHLQWRDIVLRTEHVPNHISGGASGMTLPRALYVRCEREKKKLRGARGAERGQGKMNQVGE